MSRLPRARFTQSPLLILAAAVSAGIVCGHWLSGEARSFLVVKFVLALSIAVSSLFVAKTRPRLASILIVVAFALTGLSVSGSYPQHDRLSRWFEQGIIKATRLN
jgi:hypothetical protein